jgi:DNA-directed RNA polymerase subunit RPC12/RpoP
MLIGVDYVRYTKLTPVGYTMLLYTCMNCDARTHTDVWHSLLGWPSQSCRNGEYNACTNMSICIYRGAFRDTQVRCQTCTHATRACLGACDERYVSKAAMHMHV